jgi:catechol 2,3-dioxygenase-like lactoylglutathione lyase family enzyme
MGDFPHSALTATANRVQRAKTARGLSDTERNLSMTPHGILETALYVNDLDAAERFYRDVLGLERIGQQTNRHVFFQCGRGVLLLFNPAATAAPMSITGQTIPAHGTHGPGHMAFAIHENEVGDWRQRLQEAGVAVESEVSWPQGGQSLYFRDPAGNSLELATPRIWGLE